MPASANKAHGNLAEPRALALDKERVEPPLFRERPALLRAQDEERSAKGTI